MRFCKREIEKYRYFAKMAFAGAVCLLMCAGCGEKQKQDKSVNIAYFPNITHSQALMIKNEGTLEKALGDDVKVNWTSFNAGPDEVTALFSGDIDIGYIGPIPAISANVKSKGDVVVVSGCSDGGMMLLASPDSGIENVSDLAGKNVAVPQIGNTQHLVFLDLLAENDLATTEAGGNVTVTATANAYILQLMQNGEIDAACVPEPWAETLINECGAKVICDENEVWSKGSYPVAVVVARKEFMEENPDIVNKFLKVHEETTDYLNGNAKEAMTAINEEIELATDKSIAVDILEASLEHITFNSDINADTVNAFSEICVREGFTAESPYEGFLKLE